MPLSPEQIAGCWRQEYEKAPATLARMSEINTLAAAFNANVDSVVKISGAELQRRIRQTGMTLAELKTTPTGASAGPKTFSAAFSAVLPWALPKNGLRKIKKFTAG